MRVQESKPTAGKTAIMGKKKHKLRKQAKENELCPSDSSDEGGNAGRCPHLSKGINFNTMRKALKQLGTVGTCTSCEGDPAPRPSDPRPEDAQSPAGATGGHPEVITDDLEDYEPTIWVCLQCGHQGCDRNSKEQHALKHYQTPRSNLHAVVININTWLIWCYSCDDEVSPDSSRKLQECVDFLRRMSVAGSIGPGTGGSGGATVNRAGSFKSDAHSPTDGATDTTTKNEGIPSKPKPISLQAAASVTQGLPKVKGLSNLGNTCFFNAVMQNLSQTSTLESLLLERGLKGSTLSLPGHKPDSDLEEGGSEASEGSDDDSGDGKVELPPCSITVGEPGALTQSLVSFMRDMHNPGKSGTISPNNLFGQVCKKAPRFKGFQQQDSHELLRHLLDGMKAEEIKRSQAAILKQFHLAENTNPKRVDDDTKTKVKEYGRQAKHTFVDSVFGGAFISTVQCEDCHVPSQVFEPFLDISLPILEEKTVRPNNMWSWRSKKDDDKTTGTSSAAMDELMADRGASKHQQKKAKRQAKRESKRKPRGEKSMEDTDRPEGEDGSDKATIDGKPSDPSKPQGDSRSQSDGEISDADVEDNIESDVSRTRVLSRLASRDDLDRASSSPPPGDPPRVCQLPAESSASCSSLSSGAPGGPAGGDLRGDSWSGRSEESTLTETSAGESLRGAAAAVSDSTCKASSSDDDDRREVTAAVSRLSLADHARKTSDLGSGSGSVDGAEETTNGTNGRGRSSGYSSGHTARTTTATPASRSQLRLQAKHKAMSSLAARYQPRSQECSVRSCLNQFTSAELLTGSNKFGCETCTKRKHGANSSKDGKKDTVYTNASKQVLLFQPPANLTLHLKRFQQVGFTLRKVNRHVEFPMLLDIAPFCSSLSKGVRPGHQRVLYALFGVVEHSGRLTGGHYTAYVKVRPHNTRLKDYLHGQDALNRSVGRLLETLASCPRDPRPPHTDPGDPDTPPPGKWFYISDSRVTEVNEAAVLRCQAYLLFYERIL